eukprot:TRINITY_DN49953_c0_g1_i1.p1 TRINITY_DN49953_c0_g1~~TRINITY_DN49953_c0_g1_i1.p1  ORF type:complete len:699 (-),score=137.72 TRINITY_DN49953_c0_g1_i1:74-2170(-)
MGAPLTRPCCHLEQLPRPKITVAAAPLAGVPPRLQSGARFESNYEKVGDTRPRIDGFVVEDTIARVFDVRDRQTGLLYVCRKVDKFEAPCGQKTDMVTRHLTAACSIEHPYACKMVECFDRGQEYIIISELAYGPPLADFLMKNNGDTSEPNYAHIAELVRQVATVLFTCHSRYIVHGRLEPSALLLAGPDGGGRRIRERRKEDSEVGEKIGVAQVKVRDIGLGFVLRPPLARLAAGLEEKPLESWVCVAPETAETSPAWREDAVELFRKTMQPETNSVPAKEDVTVLACGVVPPETFPVDIWALGAITHWLLTGVPLFADIDGKSVKEVISTVCTVELDASVWKNVPADARDAMASMLRLNPGLRPTAADLLRHEWLKLSRHGVVGKTLHSLFRNAFYNLQEGQFKKAIARIMIELLPQVHPHVEEATEAFLSLDRNLDGLVSVDDFEAGIAKFPRLKQFFRDSFWDEKNLFEAADRNGSGFLNLAEFMAATLPPKISRDEKWLWMAFRAFDRDEDGVVTIQEVIESVMLLDGSLMAKEQLQELCKTLEAELNWLKITPSAERVAELAPTEEQDEDDEDAFMPISMRVAEAFKFIRRNIIPPYRSLDFGEFVYLCGASPKEKQFPTYIQRALRKEGSRWAEVIADVDLYAGRREAKDAVLPWPPKAGVGAQTPRSAHRRHGGVAAKKSPKSKQSEKD